MTFYFSFQAFVRDPDGYYIEFCNCASLDEFLHKKPETEVPWTLSQATSLAKARKVFKKMASETKHNVSKKKSDPVSLD